MPRLQGYRQGIDINDVASAQVQEKGSWPHLGELLLPDHVGVRGSTIYVQRDGLTAFEQLLQAVHARRVSQCQAIHDVVEVDPHTETFGQHRQLRPDVAVADDSEGPATYLMRTRRRFVPDARVHAGVPVPQTPSHGDDLTEGQFHHGARVGVGGVEHGNPRGCGS